MSRSRSITKHFRRALLGAGIAVAGLAFAACSPEDVAALNAQVATTPEAAPTPRTGGTRQAQSSGGLTSLLCGAGLCTDRRPKPQGNRTYVIEGDGGGQIISAEADREMLRQWGGPVEIRWYCNSSCVIFTTLPNACLGPHLKIGFHSADVNRGFVGNEQIAKYLRGGIKERFLREWQYVPNDDLYTIRARDYARLDPQVRICD
ncbi:hypothetical protein SAMN05428995_102179 [Loktanella sp. DSM 29012]|uniref:Lipoprotein n=1 Tax=Loktanella gaetbuli TaxID=2881335 RepID=A0ABS8BVP1_9RHOB|nr:MULTISPECIES: hypothetical protein [Loktanella]MCB5199785.1 hypothetical protein [Loktanella gaetbuli]SEP97148.1 hypothetical protein SAMN05428995_102179 [Loktanella sp. DSM 29012]